MTIENNLPKELPPQFIEIINVAYQHKNLEFVPPEGGLVHPIKIWWQLNNDESRPNKTSKSIEINISKIFIKDYNISTEGQKKIIEDGFKERLKSHLETFDPNHNVSNPPVEVIKFDNIIDFVVQQ